VLTAVGNRSGGEFAGLPEEEAANVGKLEAEKRPGEGATD